MVTHRMTFMMSDSPKFSIVLPVYNAVDYIDDCIRSIIDQSYRNVEVIIIDGGSTDGTVEVIKKYQNEISYYESKKDGGQSYAINKVQSGNRRHLQLDKC